MNKTQSSFSLGEGIIEADFTTSVKSHVLNLSTVDTLELEEGFLPFDKAVAIFERYGFICSPEDLDTNGWQYDFWLEAINKDTGMVLSYQGSMWYGNFKLVKSFIS